MGTSTFLEASAVLLAAAILLVIVISLVFEIITALRGPKKIKIRYVKDLRALSKYEKYLLKRRVLDVVTKEVEEIVDKNVICIGDIISIEYKAKVEI